jgi:hypothetical protein
MWRSVFLHEFIDHRIGNFQALPGRPTPSSFQLAPSDTVVPGVTAVAISPGSGFEHMLDAPLSQIVGVSTRVRLVYPLNPQPRMFSVVRLGGAAELLFWPVSNPLPDLSGTLALARVWVGTGFRNLGNVILPAQRFVEFRFDWHASGQARLLADGRLVAYHNAVAPAALLSFDRVVFGMGNVAPASSQPLYHLSRVCVRALARPDAMAHLSKLLPKVKPAPDTNRCRLRIIANALAVVDRLRAFMGGMHQSLSQPWTERTGPASGPFRPEAVDAHALATTAVGELARMLRTGDFESQERFLQPFERFLRILRDAQPQGFAALAAEIDAMAVVPEDCRAAFEASEEDKAAFAPLIDLLTRANGLVRTIAGGF